MFRRTATLLYVGLCVSIALISVVTVRSVVLVCFGSVAQLMYMTALFTMDLGMGTVRFV